VLLSVRSDEMHSPADLGLPVDRQMAAACRVLGSPSARCDAASCVVIVILIFFVVVAAVGRLPLAAGGQGAGGGTFRPALQGIVVVADVAVLPFVGRIRRPAVRPPRPFLSRFRPSDSGVSRLKRRK